MNEYIYTLPHQVTFEVIPFLESEMGRLEANPAEEIVFDFSEVTALDSAGVIFIQDFISRMEKKKRTVRLANLSAELRRTMELFKPVEVTLTEETTKENLWVRLGESAYQWAGYFFNSAVLFADIFYWAFVAFFQKKLRRKTEVINQGVKIGVNALPIVALIAFLIGFILALQSAAQLRQFGANIYVADLVAVAMVSEMGPLITAILVAGRSGAAITAEIATMKVSEEIDALQVMGVDPLPYLIVPKLYALVIALPLLTVFANVIGIIGGAVIGVTYLDIDFMPFFKEVLEALRYKEIFTGMVKSVTFAVIILLTATYFGLKAKGGAEGVGKVTTSSVVASIFFVIVADSILGLIFYFGGPSF